MINYVTLLLIEKYKSCIQFYIGTLNAIKRIDLVKYNLQIYEEDLLKLKEHSKKVMDRYF